jgi:hypothetical protein
LGCELINRFLDGNIAYVIGRFELGGRLGGWFWLIMKEDFGPTAVNALREMGGTCHALVMENRSIGWDRCLHARHIPVVGGFHRRRHLGGEP